MYVPVISVHRIEMKASAHTIIASDTVNGRKAKCRHHDVVRPPVRPSPLTERLLIRTHNLFKYDEAPGVTLWLTDPGQ